MEGFKAIGLSYFDTPIEVRENVAFEGANATDLLLRIKDTFGIEEALLISTCNRTEIYYSSTKNIEAQLIALVAAMKGLSAESLSEYFKIYDTQAATKHLFEVALGLQSQVLGDIQIANQVKRAYQMSADLNLAGPYLHRLMHTIFYANKRVVQETQLQDGTASVASVAVNLIDGFISKISGPRIVLIGLGEIGQNVLENLGDINAAITLVNRTKSKAEKFAANTEITVKDFSELEEVLAENDVIISAASVASPIINAAHFGAKTLHKLLIDLSVPRSMDQDLENVPGISLYNVDQLSIRTQKARKIREKAIPQVQEIIGACTLGLESWKSEMEVSPTIQRLKNTLEQIRQEELARHAKSSDEEMALLEVATKNMIQKVIKLPVLQLKAACKRGEAETLVGVLNDLFNLEPEKQEKK